MSNSLKQMAYDTIEAHQETISDLRTQLAKANERVKELEINVKSQLPAYKAIREAFMDGVYWYEQSNNVSQIELDKEAHKYANNEIERQQLRKEQE